MAGEGPDLRVAQVPKVRYCRSRDLVSVVPIDDHIANRILLIRVVHPQDHELVIGWLADPAILDL